MKKLCIIGVFMIFSVRAFAIDEKRGVLLVKNILNSIQNNENVESWYTEYAVESIDFLFKNWAEEKIEVAVVHYNGTGTPFFMAVVYYENGAPQIQISSETVVELSRLRDLPPEELKEFLKNMFLIALVHEVEHIRWPHKETSCEENFTEEKRVWYVVNELLVYGMIEAGRDILEEFVELNMILRDCGPESQEFDEFVAERTPCTKK